MADSINQKVVAWAHGKLKNRVGRGECWDFADQALRHAGARSSATAGANDDYDWGTEIPIIAAMPGDILQFRDHVVTTTTTAKITWANGSLSPEPEVTFARQGAEDEHGRHGDGHRCHDSHRIDQRQSLGISPRSGVCWKVDPLTAAP